MNIQPWQQKILVDIESGGIKPGEMLVMTAGRGVNKSVLSQRQSYRWWRGASAECDDGVWHTVICFDATAAWIRAQDPALWMETSHPNGIGSTFDIADSLMVLLTLRCGPGHA